MIELSLRRPAAWALMALLAGAACHDWVSVPPQAERGIANSRLSALRVSTGDSSVVLKSPSTRGDSLMGLSETDSQRLVAIPFEEIDGLERRKTNVWKTGLLTLGILIAVQIPAEIADN